MEKTYNTDAIDQLLNQLIIPIALVVGVIILLWQCLKIYKTGKTEELLKTLLMGAVVLFFIKNPYKLLNLGEFIIEVLGKLGGDLIA